MLLTLLFALAACTHDGIVTSSAYPEDLVVICGEAITLNDDTTMSDTEFMARMEVARDLRHQCDYWNLSFPDVVPETAPTPVVPGPSTPEASTATVSSEPAAAPSDTPAVVSSAP